MPKPNINRDFERGHKVITRMVQQNAENGWIGWFRIVTPILVTIGLFMMAQMNAKIDKIDDKMFQHLTNDELHPPKSITLTKAEFNIYQDMRQRQMDDIRISMNTRIDALKGSMDKVIEMLDRHSRETRR